MRLNELLVVTWNVQEGATSCGFFCEKTVHFLEKHFTKVLEGRLNLSLHLSGGKFAEIRISLQQKSDFSLLDSIVG